MTKKFILTLSLLVISIISCTLKVIYAISTNEPKWYEKVVPGSSSNNYWKSIAMSSDGSKIAAAVFGGYIYTSTDGGANWTEQTSAGPRNWYSIAISSDGSKIAAADYGNGFGGYIYTSTDGGATWAQTSADARYWRSIAISSDGSKIAAADNGNGSGGYIYTSTDGGYLDSTNLSRFS